MVKYGILKILNDRRAVVEIVNYVKESMWVLVEYACEGE